MKVAAPALLALLVVAACAHAADMPQVRAIGGSGGASGGVLEAFSTDGGAGVRYSVNATSGEAHLVAAACLTPDGTLAHVGCIYLVQL